MELFVRVNGFTWLVRTVAKLDCPLFYRNVGFSVLIGLNSQPIMGHIVVVALIFALLFNIYNLLFTFRFVH